jgi:hypothetical protein
MNLQARIVITPAVMGDDGFLMSPDRFLISIVVLFSRESAPRHIQHIRKEEICLRGQKRFEFFEPAFDAINAISWRF